MTGSHHMEAFWVAGDRGNALVELPFTYLLDERRWVGFAMAPGDGPAPPEGSPIRSIERGDVIGNVTGSWTSPLLGRALMLGWQRLGRFHAEVEIDGRRATVTPTPFYDPEGLRARA